MKSAFYVKDGVTQIILTPESDFEKNILKELASHDVQSERLSIYQGSFYECRGGWLREGAGDDSTILVLRK